ncbi:hypothetical protein KUV80_13610 [Fictibacillus nanhaiensis]|uniref:hypothetical protein n=1 Tax=Fictibacillus nanhaiensis TaxID=742169 RepID=UPI001C94C49E|nr:hypothetical protein [Fictibacillus nanhaiensis]MBY6037702.1 hypothetical protein [Fictibacillus nanhaiensis]
MMFIYILITFLLSLLFFNWLMGYKKGNITLTLDDRYYDLKTHGDAIVAELEREGKQAVYKGDRDIFVNGKPYVFIERTVPIGGVPMQRTILTRK